jgi:acetyltransferase-like isoleucine patch superfamily enzyme
VNIAGYAWIQSVSIPRNWSDIRIESGSALDDGVVLLCSGIPKKQKIMIGSGTYINRNTMIDAHESVEIGRDCMIGPQCYITDGDHGYDKGALIKNQPITSEPVKIEDNVWIGAGSVILKGVTIGSGAIVGAGSVVTKSVQPDTIHAGNPARFIRNK